MSSKNYSSSQCWTAENFTVNTETTERNSNHDEMLEGILSMCSKNPLNELSEIKFADFTKFYDGEFDDENEN